MKRDNKGSTLITVIVAIAFVTILASIILGTTVVNMSMKGIDRRVKDDFYYAERGLGDVFTGVGQVTAKIAGDKYDDAFDEIGKSYETGDDAFKKFKIDFLTSCLNEYNEDDPDDRVSLLNACIVNSFISTHIKEVKVISADKALYKKTDGNTTDTAPNATTIDDYTSVVIPKVSVAAIDKKGYQSIITSDIVIDCPTVDFLGTNAEITDYAIIGCQGVYFTGSGDTELSGNLYGGLHETKNSNDSTIYPTGTDHLYGGINIIGSNVTLKSNYVVSKGDINVLGNGSKLTIESANTSTGIPSVWFDTMRTIKPSSGTSSAEVSIKNASVFALNDLELNSNNSVFELKKGDYYGYNDKTLAGDVSMAGAEANKGNSLDYTDDRVDNDSSAILINGNHCSLDLSDAHTLVLMGKAFVDFSSKGSVPSGYEKVAASAEALALQPNQQLYIVPTDFMTTPNPATSSNYPPTGFELNKTRSELDTWFGYKYVKTGTSYGDDDLVQDIYKTYAVDVSLPEGGTERVYYAYLKFNDSKWIPDPDSPTSYIDAEEYYHTPLVLGSHGCISSKAAFFDEIVKATGHTDTELQPSADRLRAKMLQSIQYDDHFDLQNAKINMIDPNAIIYGRNAIVNYDNDTPDYRIKPNTEGLERFAGYPQNLFKRYQLLCVFLNGRENSTLGGSITFTTAESDKITSDWKIVGTAFDGSAVPITSPMDHFVLLSEMASVDTTGSNDMYIGNDNANSAFGKCIVTTKAPGSKYTISGDYKGVAFVNGDVEIDSDANVDGLVMATGTITIKSGAKINANKGIIQSRIDKELSLVERGDYGYENNFLIKYLTNDGTNRIYSVTPGGKREENRIKPDYNSFMYYENWQKGNKTI